MSSELPRSSTPTPPVRGSGALRGLWLLGWGLAVITVFYPQIWTLLIAALRDPHYDAASYYLTAGFFFRMLALLALGMISAGMTLRLGRRFALRPERVLEFGDCQNGGLIFEFALAMPFILSLVFILFQWTELLIAESLVHYAAFAATRTGVTWGHMPDSGGIAGGVAGAFGAGGARFQLDASKQERMRLAAEVALAGAKALEARSDRDQRAEIELVSDPTLVEDDPRDDDMGGAYGTISARVTWGFFPRWPLAQLFFNTRAMIQGRGRIQITCGYAHQAEGYYRSQSLRFLNQGQDYRDREELTQCALYGTVLEEAHDNPQEVSGSRDQLGQSCPDRPGNTSSQVQQCQ